jgi:hypothetical protein
MVASLWTWNGWNSLVSLGTLALAVATAGMAWLTRKSVVLASRHDRLYERELAALEASSTHAEQAAQSARDQVKALRTQSAIARRAPQESAILHFSLFIAWLVVGITGVAIGGWFFNRRGITIDRR